METGPGLVVKSKAPSLLRQIVDKVDEMDDGAKKLLLLSLKKAALFEKYKNLDREIANSGEIVAENSIDGIVANTRKEMYEQKVRS